MSPYQFFFIQHDPVEVALSTSMAVAIWWGVLLMSKRGTADGEQRLLRIWWIGQSFLLGLGIWSVHFIGMLGWSPGLQLSYARGMTIVSFLPGLLGSAALLYRPSSTSALPGDMRWQVPAFAAGLGAMHYSGVLAVQTTPAPVWNAGWIALSVVLALGLGLAFCRGRSWLSGVTPEQATRSRLLLSVALGVGLVSVHFSGIAAASFALGTICTASSTFSPTSLATLVAASMVGLIAALLTLSIRDARAASNQLRANEALRTRAALLEQLVFLDPVTQLPNRLSLNDGMQSAANRDQGFATLVVCQIQGYQTVYESWGDVAANTLISEAAARLRSVALPAATLFRSGEDEFCMQVLGQVDEPHAEECVRRTSALMLQPFDIAEDAVSLTCILGYAQARSPGEVAQLFAMARSACDYAKRTGASWHGFTPVMFGNAREELSMQSALRRSLSNGDFKLLYQPKVDAGTGALEGAEALLRWDRPGHGWISPAVFLPLAEKYGLMVGIGNWVLQEALRQQAVWRANGLFLRLSINLSPLQLEQDDLVASLCALLARHGLPANCLCLEITESAAVQRMEHSVALLRRLRDIGFELSIDDFGTGYSSLGQLHNLPVQELKIDRSFVMALQVGSLPIIRATLQMAKDLGLRTVAEGVETEAQRICLQACGVTELQGYLIDKPLPPNDLQQRYGRSVQAA